MLGTTFNCTQGKLGDAVLLCSYFGKRMSFIDSLQKYLGGTVTKKSSTSRLLHLDVHNPFYCCSVPVRMLMVFVVAGFPFLGMLGAPAQYKSFLRHSRQPPGLEFTFYMEPNTSQRVCA